VMEKTEIHLAGRIKKSMLAGELTWYRRCSAIEPIIGHTKNDHRIDRNFLKGEVGTRSTISWPDAVLT